MKRLFLILSLTSCFLTDAQEKQGGHRQKMNLVKTNLTSVIFRNYQFAYERTFTKRFGVQISYGFIPAGHIPLIDEVIKDENVENIRLGGNNFTLEPRIYLGKGYGHGFYLAPYYRYSHFNIDNLTYKYRSDDPLFNGQRIPVIFSGKTNSNSIGLMIGSQWLLGRNDNWVLDIWFIGGHYGGATGTITGKSDRPLTVAEQQQLKKDIEDLDTSVLKYKVSTDASGAKVVLDSGWLGVRSGISFGYRF